LPGNNLERKVHYEENTVSTEHINDRVDRLPGSSLANCLGANAVSNCLQYPATEHPQPAHSGGYCNGCIFRLCGRLPISFGQHGLGIATGWLAGSCHNIDDRELRFLNLPAGGRFPLTWEWAPDGSRLLYAEEKSSGGQVEETYYLFDPATNTQVKLAVADGPGFQWHPYGGAILIDNRFIDSESGAVLVEFSVPTWMSGAISPDGRQLIFADNETNRFAKADIQLDDTDQVVGISSLVDLGVELQGEPDKMGELQNPPLIINMKWNPQVGQIAMVLFDYGTQKGNIYLLDPWDGSMKNLTADFTAGPLKGIDAGSLSWSPDGEQLAFSAYEIGDTNHKVFLINLNDLNITEITGGEIPYGQNPFWVPGTDAIIFAELVSDRLVVCRLDGSEKQLLGDEIQAYFSGFRP
jgi:dipeptidyl aminopeptidase/acylaminoacyl peptidase